MDTPLVKRTFNLGLKAVPNFLKLPEEVITYYESHLDEIPEALARGFTLPKRNILEFISTITIPGTTTSFFARERFVLKKDGGDFSFIGDNFYDWFLCGEGVVEDPIDEQLLRYHNLIQTSADGPIITELGGVEQCVLGLAHVYFLKKKGEWRVFYIPQAVTKLEGNSFSYMDRNGEMIKEVSNPIYLFEVENQWFVLRSVFVHWFGGGWHGGAHSVERLRRWLGGCQVFSRLSVPSSVLES